MSDIVYSNVRELLKMLDSIDPQLKRDLQKQAKEAAKPIQAAIVKAIPDRAPHRGMRGNGRLSWDNSVNYKGKKIPAKSVSVNFKSGRSRTAAITSLVRVTVNSPIVALLDTAKKSTTPQGAQLIRIMGGSPSRYVWPAAEKGLPEASNKIQKILDGASARVSRRIK